eukprot:8878831-Pyramimonas_sp.AAC.2
MQRHGQAPIKGRLCTFPEMACRCPHLLHIARLKVGVDQRSPPPSFERACFFELTTLPELRAGS